MACWAGPARFVHACLSTPPRAVAFRVSSSPLLRQNACHRHGGAFKCIKTLLRHKLLHHDSSKYDGYRLTNMGYDFLAIKASRWGRGGLTLDWRVAGAGGLCRGASGVTQSIPCAAGSWYAGSWYAGLCGITTYSWPLLLLRVASSIDSLTMVAAGPAEPRPHQRRRAQDRGGQGVRHL